MFKRVEKRRRKQEKEEELGLTGEMKEVLGMHDTDSDESDSSSGDSSDSGGSDDEGAVAPHGVEDEQVDDEIDEEDDEEESGDELSHSIPQMSVTETMQDPVYIFSTDPDVMACALCPGKLLKNTTMADIHKSSKVCSYSIAACNFVFLLFIYSVSRVRNNVSAYIGTLSTILSICRIRRQCRPRHKHQRILGDAERQNGKRTERRN